MDGDLHRRGGVPSSSNNTISLLAGSCADEAGNAGAGRVSSPFALVGAAPAVNMIQGTAGSDVLVGTAGNDVFLGVPPAGAGVGTGTIDRMTGGGGNDRFILGDSRGVFYDDLRGGASGTGDYALITDFRAGDVVQLAQGRQYFLAPTYAAGVWRTDIYVDTDFSGRLNNGDELIGILQGVTTVSLSDRQLRRNELHRRRLARMGITLSQATARPELCRRAAFRFATSAAPKVKSGPSTSSRAGGLR